MRDCSKVLAETDSLARLREDARRWHARAQDALARAQDYDAACAEALRVAQESAAQVQRSAHARIADLVTKCLRAVFGGGAYEFCVAFETKRDATQARLYLSRGGEEVDPLSGAGGGVVDVVSFALRVSALLCATPPKRRLLVLDEPFKHLSSRYRDNARKLIEELSEKLDVQFLVVTHCESLVAGKVVQL